MAWLREIMERASPPFGSFGDLARAALAHPDWPPERRPQPRSLAAIFSKLDRDQELEWLEDRPGVQLVLAELLGTPLSTLRRPLRDELAKVDRLRDQLRLDDVPYARVLELQREPLPPGLPSMVLQPPRWTRLYWFAPSGSGRSLVGKWLAARGLAAFIDARTWSDASADIAQSGPVFVELHGGANLAELLEHPPPAPLCVAAPVDLPAEVLERAGFTLVTSPAPSSFVESLVRWLMPRLPPNDHFDPEHANRFLESAIASGGATTLGDLLGLLSLTDEVDAARLRGRSIAELARSFVERRLHAERRRGQKPPEWHSRAFEFLLEMARRALTDSPHTWDSPRTLDELAALVGPEHEPRVDPRWVRASLDGRASPTTLKEVERAMRAMPPGAHRIVTVLVDLGFFREVPGTSAFTPAPRWVASAVNREARRALFEGSPYEWGEALVEPTLMDEAFDAVVNRVRRNAEQVIDDVLDLDPSTSIAQTAALEAVARATGLLLLDGSIEPPDNLDELWDTALDCIVDFADCPRPRLSAPPSASSRLTDGSYLAALLACSEALPASQGRRHLHLRPWVLRRASWHAPLLEMLLDAADRDRHATWSPSALALVARLPRTEWGPSPHPAELPAYLVQGISEGSLTWALCRQVLSRPALARAVDAVVRQAGLDWQGASRAVFEAWRAAGYADPSVLLEAAQSCAPLWRHAPLTIWSRALFDARITPEAIPWRLVPEATWLAMVIERPEVASSKAPWMVSDSGQIPLALARRLPEGSGARAVWQAHRAAALESLPRHLEANSSGTFAFVREAPDEAMSDLLALIHEHRRSVRSSQAILLLHDFVARRRADWRTAYTLLGELEGSAASNHYGKSPPP